MYKFFNKIVRLFCLCVFLFGNTPKQNNLASLLEMLYLDCSVLLRFDNLITATQMHEGEETQQNTVR